MTSEKDKRLRKSYAGHREYNNLDQNLLSKQEKEQIKLAMKITRIGTYFLVLVVIFSIGKGVNDHFNSEETTKHIKNNPNDPLVKKYNEIIKNEKTFNADPIAWQKQIDSLKNLINNFNIKNK